MVKVNVVTKTFYNRLDKIYKHWANEKNKKHWKDIQAFEISVGKVTDSTPVFRKCAMVQTWLLGYEFTATIILFTKDKVYIVTSKKMAKLLKDLPGKGNKNSVNVEIIEKSENYDETYEKLIKILSESKTPKGEQTKKIGVLVQEKSIHEGDFIQNWYKKLDASSLEQVDISTALSDVLGRKDADEVHNIKKASKLASNVLTKYLQPTIERIVVNEEDTTHLKLAESAEELMSDPKKALEKKLGDYPPDSIDSCFSPIIQSGGTYKLSLDASSTKEPLHFGTIVCLLGTRYKNYCATIGRTYMIDCPASEEKNYKILEEVYKTVLSKMKVNTKVCDVYKAAVDVIKKRNESLLPHFVKCCGYGIGLEFRESYLNITETSKKKIRNGMTFVIFVGFENIKDPNAKDPKRQCYSLLIADTILVTNEKPIVLTDADYDFGSVSYSIEDDEKEPEIVEEDLSGLDTENIRATRTRHEASLDKTAEERRRKQQQELLNKKREESKKRRGGYTTDTKGQFSLEDQLAKGEIFAYKSTKEYPSLLEHNKIYVDHKREAVLLPINGTHVPFHIATIKNASKSDEGEYVYLRINFKNPAYGFGQTYAPAKAFPGATFIKEMTLRARDPKNLTQAHREILALRKRVSQRERDIQESEGVIPQEPLKLTKGSVVPRLRDVNIRPNPKGKKTVGRLEAHENGLRFVGNRGEVVDILYANIRHAFYQSAEKDTMVILHFHLRHPILVAKKRYKDIQFYTEVMEEYDQLVGRFKRNMTDAEAIEEERRERALKQKLNREFHNFALKVQEKSNIEFDIPYRELEFIGTPNRSAVTLSPTVNCLVNLSEYPFFVLTLDEIELAYLERISFGLRNFDLIFIRKDYSKPVITINSIPVKNLDMIKDWLTQVEIKYFEGAGSLAWPKILKTIREDPAWDPWGKHGWNAILNVEEGSGTEDEEDLEDGDEYKPEESEEDDDDEEFNERHVVEEDEEEEMPAQDEEEEEGKTWEELEREARESDIQHRKKNADFSDDEEMGTSRKRKRTESIGSSKRRKQW